MLFFADTLVHFHVQSSNPLSGCNIPTASGVVASLLAQAMPLRFRPLSLRLSVPLHFDILSPADSPSLLLWGDWGSLAAHSEAQGCGVSFCFFFSDKLSSAHPGPPSSGIWR